MDATQTQYIRLHKEWNPRRKGRGARFGRGRGQQSKVISQRAFVTEREKTLIAALLEALKEERPPTEFTATIAPGMCTRVDEPGVMDSGANISVTNPLTVEKFTTMGTTLPHCLWEQGRGSTASTTPTLVPSLDK